MSRPDVLPRALVVAEEEPLVLDDRAADRSAELVRCRFRQELAGDRIGLELRERVPRLEPVALVELEHAAAKLVRARLGLHRDDAGDRLAELGVVVLRRDLRFLNRLERRVDHDDAEDRIAVLGAVELIAVPLKCCPLTIVCVEPCGFSLAACCHISCCVPGVSSTNFVKLRSMTGRSVICLVSNVRRDVGAVRLQQRGAAGDGDLLGDLADLERDATGVCVSTLTSTSGTTAALNPVSSAFTS